MDQEERREIALLAFLHGLVHSNILAIPIFLALAWRDEFQTNDLTLGILAATAYVGFGIGSVPFGYLADRRGSPSLLLTCVSGIALSLTAVSISPTLPLLAAALGSLGVFSGIYHPTGLSYISRRALSPAFILVLLVYMFAGIAYWGSLTFLPSFVGAGSYAFLLGLGAIGQVVAGHLADRPMPGRTLFILSCVGALLLVALAIGSSALLFASAWAFGFVLFSLEPLHNTLVTNAVRGESRGVAFGMTFLSVFGVGSVGAILAGYLLSRDAPGLLFLLLAAFLAISGFFGWRAGLGTSAAPQRGQKA